MSTVLKRSLIFQQEDNQEIEDLHQSLSQGLKVKLSTHLGLEKQPAMLAGWPTANWSNSYGSMTVTSKEFRAENVEKSLLRVQLVQRYSGHTWMISLILGRLRKDEVKLSEEWSIEWGDISAFRQDVPFEELPDLLSFASDFVRRNEDGLIANRPYVVSISRVEAFVDFIKSPERWLPVIVVSGSHGDSGYLLKDATAMARTVQGLAHLIKLGDNATARRLRELLPKHACYSGAVRVLWPGFKATHSRDAHPVWLPGTLRRVEDSLSIHDEIFKLIAERSTFMPSRGDDVADLEQYLLGEHRKEQRRQYETELREQIQAKLEKQAIAELAELSQAYDELKRERDSLLEDNSHLREASSQQDHKIRALRWQLNNAWRSERRLEPEEEQLAIRSIFLSSEAYKQYRSFDSHEQGYWDAHILEKLLDEQLRSNQSEPVDGPNGTCWVYPRSKSASGRRLIYFSEDDGVFVCELLKHDREYDQLRNQGVDREAYEDFEEYRSNAG